MSLTPQNDADLERFVTRVMARPNHRNATRTLKSQMKEAQDQIAAVPIVNVKGARATVISLATGSVTTLTLTWPAPFPSLNYSPSVAIFQSGGTGLSGLVVLRISNKTVNDIDVTIANNAGGALSGAVSAVGVAD